MPTEPDVLMTFAVPIRAKLTQDQIDEAWVALNHAYLGQPTIPKEVNETTDPDLVEAHWNLHKSFGWVIQVDLMTDGTLRLAMVREYNRLLEASHGVVTGAANLSRAHATDLLALLQILETTPC